MDNNKLSKARRDKKDEFYTQYHDIEKEISAYVEFNPKVFKGKTILLPCDDPEWSNFTKYFAQNFQRYEIKKLISTSFAVESKSYKEGYQPTLFERNDPNYNKKKTRINGKIFTLTKDKSGDGKIDVNDLEWDYLKGDGDFRSKEINKLKDEADTRFIKVGDNITEWNNLDYVKVPNSSIQFPPFPPVNLIIGDGEFGISNPRILCSLSNNDYLNIVGRNGITANYSDTHKALVLSLTQPYNPVYSGTLYSPSTSGQPGNVAYDDQWMYVCVKNNFWKKLPLEQYWFDPTSISVSNNSGNYPSMTNIAFSGSNMLVNTDGDPYPALAGYNLTNDGITSRNGFFGSYDIQDQSFNYNFRYRGPSYSSNPQPIGSGIIGIMTNGALFTSFINNPNKIDIFQVPSGLRFNKVFFSDYFRLDPCGGEVVLDRSYRYLNGKFLTTCWNNSLLINSNAYYSGTSYNNNYFRHPDGHSKIVGFCFDGYPLYGPYGYTNPTSSASGVSLMTSSYIAKNTDHHRPPNWKFSNAIVVNDINFMLSTGAFVEDFDFYEGSGILDQYNGRFAVTPEYPEGVYAYYLTFTDDSLAIPKYPYIIGPYSRQQRPI